MNLPNMQINSPSELQAQKEIRKAFLIHNAAGQIAAEINSKFVEKEVEVWIDGGWHQMKAIMPELEKIFGDKGWKISLGPSQRSNFGDVRVNFLLTDKSFKTHNISEETQE